MKIFSVPDNLKVPSIFNGNSVVPMDQYMEAERAFIEKVKEHLIEQGYTGPNTGKVYRIPHADGYAQYAVAEGPAGSRVFALVHLPLMDAWDSPHADRVTKKDVLAYVNRKCLFGSL